MQTKKRKFKIEHLLAVGIAAVLICTVGITITLTSFAFQYNKEIVTIDYKITDIKQEAKELEVKKQEKLTYDQVSGYAAQGGLSSKQENIKRVR